MIRLRRLALGQLRTSMRTKLRPVENEIGCRQVSAVGFGATDIACIVAGAVVAYPAMKWMWWLSQGRNRRRETGEAILDKPKLLAGYTAQTASLVKMLQHPDATPSNEDMFKFLDGDGDGRLNFGDAKTLVQMAMAQGLVPREGLDLAGLKSEEGIAVLLATEIWIDCGKHTYGDAFNTLRFNVNRHAYDQDGFNQVAECFWNGLRDRLR